MWSAPSDGKTRTGLVLCLDLERYDYTKGSTSLIRATEGTIVERLPPRMKIRQGAALELPHILVLIDDPQRTVIEPVGAAKSELEKLYDFDLMLGSGHLTGYAVSRALGSQVVACAARAGPAGDFSPPNTASARKACPAVCHGRRQPFPGHGQGHLGKDEAAGRAWITRPAMPWSRSRMSTMKAWSSSPSTVSCSA